MVWTIAAVVGPLALLQSAGPIAAPPPAPPQPVSFEEQDWHPAARQWSLRVMRTAQQLYQRGLVRDAIEGALAIRFVIGIDGETRGCQIERSSTIAQLDALGCEALMRAGPAPVLLDDAGQPKAQAVVLPMRFLIADIQPDAVQE